MTMKIQKQLFLLEQKISHFCWKAFHFYGSDSNVPRDMPTSFQCNFTLISFASAERHCLDRIRSTEIVNHCLLKSCAEKTIHMNSKLTTDTPSNRWQVILWYLLNTKLITGDILQLHWCWMKKNNTTTKCQMRSRARDINVLNNKTIIAGVDVIVIFLCFAVNVRAKIKWH